MDTPHRRLKAVGQGLRVSLITVPDSVPHSNASNSLIESDC